MREYISFWQNYANFSGVASRREYWTAKLIHIAVYSIIILLIGGIGTFIGIEDDNMAYVDLIISGLFLLASAMPLLSITVRRLHDVNMSGWFYLLIFAPMGNIAVFIFTVLASQHDNNKWINTH